MKNLEQYYLEKCNIPSDINEHLPVFKRYALECDTIIEMGVRGIVSTWAFMSGRPRKLVGIDISHPSEYGGNLDDVYRIANEEGIDYEFRLQSTLDCTIEECDLLFIDTWHDYLQLRKELYRHHSKVKKYMIFHDTGDSFGFKDENSYDDYNNQRKETNLPKGLVPAIDEFLSKNDDWFIYERFNNNNGITILKRK